MRPKKNILLIDGDEMRQSLTRIVLEVHRFRVVSAASAEAALEVNDVQLDCVLGFWPLDTSAAFDIAKRWNTALIVVDENEEVTADDVVAHCYLCGRKESRAANLLASIKSATARRRGPGAPSVMVYEMRKAVAA